MKTQHDQARENSALKGNLKVLNIMERENKTKLKYWNPINN